ncbi:Dcp2, box A domain-containing protein [Pelagophyceae sp. CCMP2097]|nr:Dcp2, box A domain-containing protein [Pelagophyceae sp. CCMP2097]|mmetsp:Transcript_1178/g.3651  ORF Transcript_1178/g.3651 Transcript_1178/m.3651 type:complete len:319 (-) Transcript_1178:28-984(-)
MGFKRVYVGEGVWEDVDDGKPDAPPKPGGSKSLDVALDDVATRFLIHLPASELQAADRLFFQIEQAHWFYEDFLADAPESKLPHMTLKAFTQALFKRCALLRPMQQAVEELSASFRVYKGKIPVCGCILLDESLRSVVLVCNWTQTSWGLPKGKLNQGEALHKAALREVLEETGYDAANKIDQDNPIEVVSDGQRAIMFVGHGVPLDFPFEPRVRKEISKVEFFPLDALPGKQWNVEKFIPHIKKWINNHRRKLNVQKKLRKTSPAGAPPDAAAAPAAGDANDDDAYQTDYADDAAPFSFDVDKIMAAMAPALAGRAR